LVSLLQLILSSEKWFCESMRWYLYFFTSIWYCPRITIHHINNMGFEQVRNFVETSGQLWNEAVENLFKSIESECPQQLFWDCFKMSTMRCKNNIQDSDASFWNVSFRHLYHPSFPKIYTIWCIFYSAEISNNDHYKMHWKRPSWLNSDQGKVLRALCSI